MRHIRSRHALVGILESTTGGLVVSAFIYKSIWLGLLAVVLGGAAVGLDYVNIDDEEQELHGKS